MASQVTESLSREIFDDEIFNSTDVCAEKAELEKSDLAACGNADNTPPSPSQAADTLIIERKIKPKKKKCQREPKQIIQHENEKSILQEAEKQLQLPNIQKEKSIEKTEINAEEIAEAIDKAFQKVEKEENSTESSSSKRKFLNLFFSLKSFKFQIQHNSQYQSSLPQITSNPHRHYLLQNLPRLPILGSSSINKNPHLKFYPRLPNTTKCSTRATTKSN